MKRRIFATFLAALMALSAIVIVPVSAQTSGNWEYSVNFGEATVTKYTGSDTHVTLPSEIDGYSVTDIGAYTFSDRTDITDITISDGVVCIAINAFSGCSSLKSVTLPESVNAIHSSAFENCTSLESVIMPSEMSELGRWVFENCTSLKSISFPQGITVINDGICRGCTSLESVTIPASVTEIVQQAFFECTSIEEFTVSGANKVFADVDGVVYDKSISTLIMCPQAKKSVSIPDSVTAIGECAFWECSGIGAVVLPNQVNSIGSFAFYGCSSLKNINIPDGVTAINQSVFDGCNSLESITVPNGVSAISSRAFADCSSLKSAVLPEGVTEIGEQAFCGCASLVSITVPASIKNVRYRAFAGCTSLASVIYGSTREEWSHIIIWKAGNDVLSDALKVYEYTYTLEDRKNTDWEYTIVGIGDAFTVTLSKYIGSDTAVVIPGKVDTYPVTVIGNGAFSNKKLESIVIPDSVESIGPWAFAYCKNLENIVIPDNVTELGAAMFYNCENLKNVRIGEGVTVIRKDTFYFCENLEVMHLPASLEKIEDEAFSGFCELAAVKYGASVREWNRIDVSRITNAPLFNAKIEFVVASDPGDANGDGAVNVKDIIVIMRYLVGWCGEIIDTAAADYNGDGDINARDIIAIMRNMVK